MTTVLATLLGMVIVAGALVFGALLAVIAAKTFIWIVGKLRIFR